MFDDDYAGPIDGPPAVIVPRWHQLTGKKATRVDAAGKAKPGID